MPRNFTQRCLNCEIGDQCQDTFDKTEVQSESTCNEMCSDNTDCKLSIYDLEKNICKMYDCSLVKENTNMVVHRRSTSNGTYVLMYYQTI